MSYRILIALPVLLTCLGCRSNEPDGSGSPGNYRAEAARSGDESTADSREAAEIIEAAIEAHGGESNFPKANVGQTIMIVDEAFGPGISGRYRKIDIFDWPAKHKRTLIGEAHGEKIDMIAVINGDQAWMQIHGDEPLSQPVINPGQGVYPNDNLGALLALKSSAFQLSVGLVDKIGERPVDCIRIEAECQWVGDLFFDKETHLLVASKKELFDDTIGKSRVIEAYYSAYVTVDGLNLPMCIKTIIDGETTTTITVTDVKFMNEIDDGVFAKPVKRK